MKSWVSGINGRNAPKDNNLNLSHLRVWITNRLRELEQTTALEFGKIKAEEDAIAQNLAYNGCL